MYAKRSDDFSSLPRAERLLVLYARLANHDTWHGGCEALTRADRSGNREAIFAVSNVYSASSGRVPDSLDAFECGECGHVYYGRESAENCCQCDDCQCE